MVEQKHPSISLTRQCKLLGVARSTLNYKPVKRSKEDIEHIKFMKKTFLKNPCIGSRKIVGMLKKRKKPIIVNRKRIQRLRREIGMKAIYCKPRTTIPNKEHKKYPYLLRNLVISRSNQVWCTDITYVPMPYGKVYLCAIMDWYSRKILSWKISNTMDVSLCQQVFFDAIKHTRALPEIFNTDQGSQFTSTEWIDELKKRNISISMDGKGRWVDNVFIERVWNTVKYECIFLHEYSTMSMLQEGVQKFIRYYNLYRPHQTHDYNTPHNVYKQGLISFVHQQDLNVFNSILALKTSDALIALQNSPNTQNEEKGGEALPPLEPLRLVGKKKGLTTILHTLD